LKEKTSGKSFFPFFLQAFSKRPSKWASKWYTIACRPNHNNLNLRCSNGFQTDSKRISSVVPWKTNGRQMEDKWKTNGKQMENKWKTNGIQMEYKWNTNGEQME